MNLKTDPRNCGICANACQQGMLCSDGACTCASGTRWCADKHLCAPLCDANQCQILSADGRSCTSTCSGTGWSCYSGGRCCKTSGDITTCRNPGLTVDPCSQPVGLQSSLGVYSLSHYESGWKDAIGVGQDMDPYYGFWNTMTAGPGLPHADPALSQRFLDAEVTSEHVIPVSASTEKSWDDFNLVFFYGHNTTIVPPHDHDYFSYWLYQYDPQLARCDWKHQYGNVNGKWGTTVSIDYYGKHPIVDADVHPGAVTYLYNQYTASLIGPTYDFGEWSYWHQRWSDPLLYNKQGKLGSRRLKWLILNGCQAVITANKDGSYNPLAFQVFTPVHGGFHIVLGHYHSYSTNEFKVPLASFANDILYAGTPIQAAYFDLDPSTNTSAIAAEKWSATGAVDWASSTMQNDRWNGALADNVGTNTFSMRWILPSGAETQVPQSMGPSPALNVKQIPVASEEARKLLRSDHIAVRSRRSSFAPRGELPVIELEQLDDAKVGQRMRELVSKQLVKEPLGAEVKTMGGVLVSRGESASAWMERASGAYKVTRTRPGFAIRLRRAVTDEQAVQRALDVVARQKLVDLAPEEEMDLLFVSRTRTASVGAKARKPVEEFESDYYVGFGRRIGGIPVIGSKLVLRMDGAGEVAMVHRNWRRIGPAAGPGAAAQRAKVSGKSLPELIVGDPTFRSRHPVAAERGRQPTPADIQVLESACGYMEAPGDYVQRTLRPGCAVVYSLGAAKNEAHPQAIQSLEDGGDLSRMWGVRFERGGR